MTDSLERTGLSSETIGRINDVFARCQEIDLVVLYGSRAKGTFRHGSDLDLTIMGDRFPEARLSGIETELDDLLLPYKIDLSLFRRLENDDLVEHIRRVGVPLYRR